MFPDKAMLVICKHAGEPQEAVHLRSELGGAVGTQGLLDSLLGVCLQAVQQCPADTAQA